MGGILDKLDEWLRGLLIEGITGNLSGMFDTVNTKVGEIAGEVGQTPLAWNSGVFSMIRNLSETVIVPIAGVILTFVMCYELIQLVTEKNNLHDVDMATLGNREDLFPGSGYVDKYTKPPTTYDIPPSALEDETFAALITEAEKYIGYPYVWGGSNPNTSFDCSGFVSWVLTQSGVCNTGRLGAQGLYNISTPVSSANARPGDLIFFVGTYDTPGVSHVGIYVGGGKMLHCGDPIQYADINTSYWQSHFYAFGRPPYN